MDFLLTIKIPLVCTDDPEARTKAREILARYSIQFLTEFTDVEIKLQRLEKNHTPVRVGL